MPVVLGTGNFGQVYQGELVFQDGTARSVAVKKLNGNCIFNSLSIFGEHKKLFSLVYITFLTLL